jgi:hypothetical protein
MPLNDADELAIAEAAGQRLADEFDMEFLEGAEDDAFAQELDAEMQAQRQAVMHALFAQGPPFWQNMMRLEAEEGSANFAAIEAAFLDNWTKLGEIHVRLGGEITKPILNKRQGKREENPADPKCDVCQSHICARNMVRHKNRNCPGPPVYTVLDGYMWFLAFLKGKKMVMIKKGIADPETLRFLSSNQGAVTSSAATIFQTALYKTGEVEQPVTYQRIVRELDLTLEGEALTNALQTRVLEDPAMFFSDRHNRDAKWEEVSPQVVSDRCCVRTTRVAILRVTSAGAKAVAPRGFTQDSSVYTRL